MHVTGQAITSTLAADGTLTVALAPKAWPAPTGREVLVAIAAAPVNPSDIGLLFGPADLANATFAPGQVVARMPEAALALLAARFGQAMPVGNEGAGTVIGAGEHPDAQALLGRRVACFAGGGMFASHVLIDAASCMALPNSVSAEAGAAAFVNPLTALSFVETMRREGFSALVHTAAASNLGQMLVRICREDGIGLVNIVRSPEQAALLRGLGAEHVIDSSTADFDAALVAAIRATGARLGFDAIGGGTLAGRILRAMETVASDGAPYSRYGSDERKKVYIYGALDHGPTTLQRNFGFTWDLSGWLLMPVFARFGADVQERLRQRVLAGLTTTFASAYKARVSLDGMLTREAVSAYAARRTGEKYLVVNAG